MVMPAKASVAAACKSRMCALGMMSPVPEVIQIPNLDWPSALVLRLNGRLLGYVSLPQLALIGDTMFEAWYFPNG